MGIATLCHYQNIDTSSDSSIEILTTFTDAGSRYFSATFSKKHDKALYFFYLKGTVDKYFDYNTSKNYAMIFLTVGRNAGSQHVIYGSSGTSTTYVEIIKTVANFADDKKTINFYIEDFNSLSCDYNPLLLLGL